jgi:membrane protein DedA with SNARE-associated domain
MTILVCASVGGLLGFIVGYACGYLDGERESARRRNK